jgi:hypothetical protein
MNRDPEPPSIPRDPVEPQRPRRTASIWSWLLGGMAGWLSVKLLGPLPGILALLAAVALWSLVGALFGTRRIGRYIKASGLLVIIVGALLWTLSIPTFIPSSEVEVSGELEVHKLADSEIGVRTQFNSQKCTMIGRVRNNSKWAVAEVRIDIEVIDSSTRDVIYEQRHTVRINVPPNQARDFTSVAYADFRISPQNLEFRKKSYSVRGISILEKLRGRQ